MRVVGARPGHAGDHQALPVDPCQRVDAPHPRPRQGDGLRAERPVADPHAGTAVRRQIGDASAVRRDGDGPGLAGQLAGDGRCAVERREQPQRVVVPGAARDEDGLGGRYAGRGVVVSESTARTDGPAQTRSSTTPRTTAASAANTGRRWWTMDAAMAPPVSGRCLSVSSPYSTAGAPTRVEDGAAVQPSRRHGRPRSRLRRSRP